MQRLLFLLIFVIIQTVSTFSQNAYNIQGHILENDGTDWVYLYYPQKDNYIVDSCSVKDGQFSFTGRVEYPVMAILELKQKKNTSLQNKGEMTKFYIENSKITIDIPSSFYVGNTKVTGSSTHNLHLEFMDTLQPIRQEFEAIQSEYELAMAKGVATPNFMESLKNKQTIAHHKNSQMVYTFVDQHPSDYFSLYLLQSQLENMPDDIQIFFSYSKLSPNLRTSYLGEQLNTKLKKVKVTAIGSKAPMFEIKDIDQKQIKLADFEGKYVLLVFWASDCQHCLQELPNLTKAYNALASEDFAIISIAVDAIDRKEYWYNFVKDNKLAWTNLFDERENGKKKLSTLYSVDRTPSNFLLNREGKIVAKNIYGDELLRRIQTILHLSQTNQNK